MFDGGTSVPEALLRDMAAMLAHRGPDDEGFFNRGPAGLGHRRLSIIDIAGGHQPMANEDDSLWIVFNGEIYNHAEVRKVLEAKGHRYRTWSDTETILHAYEEYGPDCTKHLRGMFAFAIWDTEEKSLFLARDRFGIKPLYYRTDRRGITFASEMKALLVEPGCEASLDPIAVYDYFTSYVFGTNTMFQGIQRLEPGHWLLVKDGRVRTQRYYEPSTDPAVAARSVEENVARLESLLEEVIRDHMMSEVPQGAFLSGGVDSSLITILMSRLMQEPVRTFSIAFSGNQLFDESAYARQVADACGTVHQEYACTPEHMGMLPEVLWHLEEPLADAPTIALLLLCREAARDVTVVHCGDGGDEVFGGYPRFYYDLLAPRYNAIPAWMRRGLLMPACKVARRLPARLRNLGRQGEKYERFAALPPAERYMSLLSITPDAVKHKMLHPDFLASVGEHRSAEVFEELLDEGQALGLDPLSVRQYHDLQSFVPHSLMLKGDKLAMAAGIEGRYPFLDHRVVEFGLSLPPNQRAAWGRLKLAPRRVLARHMPRRFAWRRKQGFAVPIEEWFKASLKDRLHETISEEATAGDGILNPAYLQELAMRLHAGDPHVWPHLWSVFVFQEWRRVFSDPVRVCREHLG
jgi:asparagine synthase (glutamine-hydrolysing)